VLLENFYPTCIKENNIFIVKEDFVRGSIDVGKKLNELNLISKKIESQLSEFHAKISITEYAALNGHLEVWRWARENSCPGW